jgi:hypothetical protein
LNGAMVGNGHDFTMKSVRRQRDEGDDRDGHHDRPDLR